MSGKSRFVSELIQHQKEEFDRGLSRVGYCYGEWQPGFIKYRKRGNVGVATVRAGPSRANPTKRRAQTTLIKNQC